jgi:hypothetical protein
LEKGEQAVHDAVVAYRASRRAGTAMTKTRGLVRGGGAKPFRQKGMGRARAGSNRSPVWVGGGTIFGPVPRSFAKKVNKKVLQLALKRAIGDNILRTGYCLTPRNIRPELHPEQGTIWKWIIENDEQVYGRYTDCYGKEGAGALRKCSDETMEEIHKIFEVTGGKEFFDAIEQHSDRKAREMGFEGADERYFMEVYTHNSNEHY